MFFAENGVEVLKELFTSCAGLIFGTVGGLFGFICTVCLFLFNRVPDLFVDSELRFESLCLCLPMLPFQVTELLHDTAEPGRWLPCTDCGTVKRGILVKDRTEKVIVSISQCVISVHRKVKLYQIIIIDNFCIVLFFGLQRLTEF